MGVEHVELKPCPFCGSKPVMRERSGDERNGYNTSLELDCKCGASIETETENDGGLPTETVASAKRRLRDAWNTRAALTPPEGYLLVPVEPTQEMQVAALRSPWSEVTPAGLWAAMLTARPEVSP